jgi:hypothetical protein
MGTKSKFGTGLACVGVAVTIGQWLILPEAISYEVRFSIVLAAVGLCLAGIFMICQAAWQRYRGSSADQIKTKPESLTPDGFMSLHEAVRKLHDAAKQGKIPMMGAETMSGGTWDNIKSGSEDDIYCWWAMRISDNDAIEMRGRRPPSRIWEQLTARVKKNYLFKEKATKLKDPMDDNVYFTDLCIKQDAFIVSYYMKSAFHQD